MLSNFVYDLLLLILAVLAAPKLLYQWAFHKKYRNSIPERFGIGFPKIEKGDRSLVWVHAVSMGETKAVSAIVRRIKKQQPEAVIVTSSVTETGLAEAERSMPEADHHVFLPFDFLWIVSRIVRNVRPDIVILCETDFWHNFLKCCKKAGAKIFLVNGKLSKRSLDRYKKVPWFSNRLFSYVDKFCVQSEHYKERFLQLGIDPSKISVTGNIKFDGHYKALTTEKAEEWKKRLGLPEDHLVLVAGSTHDPEEKLLIDTFTELKKKHPKLALILVPRHPERFDEVAKILERKGIAFRRFSQGAAAQEKVPVILIDAMGLLRQCYQIADIALVAGSYTSKVGGHNIIEPSWYGVPVVYGPHMHSQPELVELVEKYQAGIQVDQEKLSTTLERLLSETSERRQLGEKGKQMVQDLQGAADKTYGEITAV